MNRVSKILFCFSLLALSSFVQIPLYRYDFATSSIGPYDYSLQFIICFVLALLFTDNHISKAVILYLIFGIFGLPIFANGGGFAYFLQSSFGYLLALLPLAIITHSLRKAEFASYFQKAAICPLAIIGAHLFGIIFLVVTARADLINFVNMSMFQIFYDLLFALLFSLILLKRDFDKEPEELI